MSKKLVEKYNQLTSVARDLVHTIIITILVFILSVWLDLFELLYEFSHINDYYHLDDLIIVLVTMSLAMGIFSLRRWRELRNEIADHKNSELKLQKSRAQLQAVLDGVPDLIIQVDSHLRIVWGNKSAIMKNPDAIGHFAHVAYRYAEGTFIDSCCKWAMDMGRIEKAITYMPAITRTGRETYWETIGVPLSDLSGNVYGAIAIARNVTERMRLEHTWNLLSSIVESTDDAIFGLSYDGTILSWNRGAEAMYGYTATEIVGNSIGMLIPVNLRMESLKKIEKVMRKDYIEHFETVRITKSGKTIQVYATLCSFLDATGKKIGVSSIDRDITDARKAELALRDSEERYRSFVTNFQGIAYRLKFDFKPVFFHGAVKELTGFTEDDFSTEKIRWNGIILPEDLPQRLEHISSIAAVPGFEAEYEYRIKCKDKSIRWVHEHLQNVTNAQGKPIYIQGTIHDITKRREAEEELKTSREHLRNLALHLETAREEERKRIAFEIHDELGYLLTALKLDVAWLGKKLGGRDESLTVKAKEMTEHLDTTIQKVRTISTQLRPSILDHFGLVAAIEWHANEFQRRSAVRCRVSVEPNELSVEPQMATAIFRIIQETLTNVARHAKATRVDIAITAESEELTVVVSDNGVGISMQQLENKKSFGLLGIRERTKFMGGNVEISGETGQGTTIVVKVPFITKPEEK